MSKVLDSMKTAMNKFLGFLKNKSAGYFIVAADALLALILAIIFFMTYQGAMATNASANVPETIGIFLLAGFVVEIVVLVIPQYRFIHIVAIAMFALSLYKEVFLIPNLIADVLNNVKYQGGDLNTNLFYLITLFIILISAIVAAFLGFYKKSAQEEDNMAVKGFAKLGVVIGGVVIMTAAVLSSTLVSVSLQKKAAIGSKQAGPITEKIRKAADAVEYDFDPTTVIIKQKEESEYDYANAALQNLAYGDTRDDSHLVYVFEGTYAEGYLGDYRDREIHIYLWEDGLFSGKSDFAEFKGYWYNSSIEKGKNENGDDIEDCLQMVSNYEHFESIGAEAVTGSSLYDHQAYVFVPNGDGRSAVVSGYRYYPDVAIFIDTGDYPQIEVGEKFFIDSYWTLNRVTKNLKYSPVVNKSEVKWTIPDGMLDANKKVTKAGKYEITAEWHDFKASATLYVV